MAEFMDVMKQAKRMCAAHEACYKCPLKDHTAMCAGNKNLSCIASKCDVSELERIVMDWAAANPEPKYPTWEQWWKNTFPDASEAFPPCRGYFMDLGDRRKNCRISCEKCKKQPIPADIAEKLGVKPMEVTK